MHVGPRSVVLGARAFRLLGSKRTKMSAYNKPWNRCRVRGCAAWTASGESEPTVSMRYCNRHMPGGKQQLAIARMQEAAFTGRKCFAFGSIDEPRAPRCEVSATRVKARRPCRAFDQVTRNSILAQGTSEPGVMKEPHLRIWWHCRRKMWRCKVWGRGRKGRLGGAPHRVGNCARCGAELDGFSIPLCFDGCRERVSAPTP